MEIGLLFILSDRLMSPPVISGDCVTVYPFWPPTVTPVISGQCVTVYPFWPATVTFCYKWRLWYCLSFLTAYCHPLLLMEIVLLFTFSDRLLLPPVISGDCVTVYPFWPPTFTPVISGDCVTVYPFCPPTVTPVISGQCVTVYPYWPPTVTHCYKWRLCYCLSFLTAYCYLLL